MLTKPVTSVIIAVLVVALIYSSSIRFDVYAVTKGTPENPECTISGDAATCCWNAPNIDGEMTEYCMNCLQNDDGTWKCGSVFCPGYGIGSPNCKIATEVAPPPQPTPGPENALPQGDVQQSTPTPPPTRGKGLFGSEGLPTPPTGLAPPTEPRAPTSEPIVPPETDQGEQDETNGGGGIKPPVKDLLPDTGITEQPDVQQPEEPLNEGQDTNGPLT